MESENRESYISCTIPQFPPLVAIAVMFIMSYDKEKQIP